MVWVEAMTLISHIRQNFVAAFLPRQSEWGSAVLTFVGGYLLDYNADLMTGSPTHAFDLMLAVADQPTWAFILKVFGSVRLVILLVNGAWRRSPYLRALMSLLAVLLWTQLALSFSATLGFAFLFACGWIGMDLISVMRAMGDARTVDDAYRGMNRGKPA